MKLSPIGIVVQSEILKTYEIRKNIVLEEYVIMPNHIHLLVQIKSLPIVETHCVRLK